MIVQINFNQYMVGKHLTQQSKSTIYRRKVIMDFLSYWWLSILVSNEWCIALQLHAATEVTRNVVTVTVTIVYGSDG